jgi:hypothetical protein
MNPRTRNLLLLLIALGVATAALAAGWLGGILDLPLVVPDDAVALLVLPPPAFAGLVLGAALLGAGSALVLLAPGVRGDPRVLLPAAAVQLAVFGLVVQGISLIALAGYLLALLLPLALVLVGVQVVRRYPRLRLVVALAALAVVAWGVLTGSFAPDGLRRLGVELGGGFLNAADQLLPSVLFTAVAGGWVVLAGRVLRGTPWLGRLTDRVVRHRRGITVLAALGPVPYALARATWLTPWPQLGGPIEQLTPEIRLWGVLLGAAALLGTVLTLGLIRPWGEVFPRWMPGLAGRPVPVAVAAVPGGVVAAIVCVSAVPMTVSMLVSDLTATEKAVALLAFPFAVWGPALALAVWGYVAHRSSRPGPADGPSTQLSPHGGTMSR